MKDILNLGVVNFASVWGDKRNNLNRILDYIEVGARKGVQMIVFPETSLTGYDVEPNEMEREERMHRRLAETAPGMATDAVCELTRKYGMYAVFGMPERDSSVPDKVYNSAAVCGPEGLIGTCRKIHLPFTESLWANKGDLPFLFDTPWGPIGVGICYDFYCFPEITRYCRAMGARLFINCTAICTLDSPGAGGYLGNLCLQYQAMNNDMFIATSNLCGRDLSSWFMGGSSVLGPSSTMTELQYYAGKPFLAPDADESGLEVCHNRPFRCKALFLNSVWEGGIEKGDWRPDLYMQWFNQAIQKNYWGKI